MQSPLAWLRRRVLTLDRETALAPLREFAATHAARARVFDPIVDAFVAGYEAALEDGELAPLITNLDRHAPRWRGFAYEGAGMALWLLDAVALTRGERWTRFVSGPASAHTYLLHVGAGWAITRLHQDWSRSTASLDPILRWLTLDGAGFHAGYFESRRFHREHALPDALDEHARRVFDQGLGRSLWFADGADAERVGASIAAFAPERRADLWSGVGLACAYAGGIEGQDLDWLFARSSPHREHFAQGVAFAVAARHQGGIAAEHTDATCRRIWNCDPKWLTELVRNLARDAVRTAGETVYENWRRAVRDELEPVRSDAAYNR